MLGEVPAGSPGYQKAHLDAYYLSCSCDFDCPTGLGKNAVGELTVSENYLKAQSVSTWGPLGS